MRRIAAAVFTIAAFSLVPLVGVSGAAADSWVATATQGIPLANATNLGAVPASTPMHISAALALRNKRQLDNYIVDAANPHSPVFGQSLTPRQFVARFGPTSAQVTATEQYLASKGFSHISVTSNHLYVSGDGTAADADSAFHTAIDSFKQNGQVVYANVQPAMVPAYTQHFIIAVLGLNNAIKMQLPKMASSTMATPPTSYWAPGFRKAYGATKTATGSKTAIAIFAEGDLSTVVSDLRAYEKDAKDNGKMPKVPVTIVHTGIPSADTSGQVEFDMDTQTSTGLAGSVKHLYLYDATALDDSDVALEFNKFVTQDKAKAGSASFGECEYAAYLDGMMVANDQSMAEAAAQGQTVFASSGDSGGFCAVSGVANGVPAGEPDVNYPASSPYVTAAGGTTLYTNTDGSWNMETAWDSGGGGPSMFEYQPSWQNGVAPPTSTSCQAQAPACLGRDLPDVGMDADFLLSAANFYSSGAATSNGGTSLASPLSLGSWARIESAHNNKIGFASPRLYAAAGSKAFNSITPSDCGPYPATPGWNYCTGNGSFNISQAIAHITATAKKVKFAPVPAPACNLFYGNGHASPVVSTGNDDALAIESGGMSTDNAKGTLTGVLHVKSLNDGPAGTTEISGSGDQWYIIWDWKSTTFFLSATYDANTLPGFSFSYGHIAKVASSSSYTTDGTGTGSVDTAKGLINITAPLSAFGASLSPKVTPPAKGNTLDHVGAQSFEEIGTSGAAASLQGADSATGGNYKVGRTC